jgi:hypothetical protein
MAATHALPRRVTPADVQGDPLARLLIAHPDIAGEVFSHLTLGDATALRAACRGLCVAVAEHAWALPVPPPDWLVCGTDGAGRNLVRSPVGLARWRSAFPAATTLLAGAPAFDSGGEPLTDASLAPLAAWGLTGVHLHGLWAVTADGLAHVLTPALTSLSLRTKSSPAADLVAALRLRSAPNLRHLTLVVHHGVLDAHLLELGGVSTSLRTLAITCDRGFLTGAGLASLGQLRVLTIGTRFLHTLLEGALTRLPHLEELSVGPQRPPGSAPRDDNESVHSRLFEGAPASLARVSLHGFTIRYTDPGARAAADDGGAALLAPLRAVPAVTFTNVHGLTDDGLCQLTGAQVLVVVGCPDVRGAELAPLAGSLSELTVHRCGAFTGAGVGSLGGLVRLSITRCGRLSTADAFAALAAGCPRLERVEVVVGADAADSFDASAAEGALAAGGGVGAGAAGNGWAFDHTGLGGRRWVATRAPPPQPAA